MIQLAGLTKSFGERVLLDDVTWQVTDGERVGLCGPNGAGKTTLLKAISGSVHAEAGRITFQGRDLQALSAARRAR